MSRHVTIDVEARFIDGMSGEARSAVSKTQRELNRIEKEKVKPAIDIDNNKFLKKVRDSEAQMRKLGRMEGAMILKAIDKASTVIAKVINKGHSFGSKVWNAFLKVNDSAALTSLRNIGRMGRDFAGKTWRTTVKIVDYATAPLRKLKDMLFSIKSLVMAITAGLAAKQFIVNPVGLADAYSGAQIGFSTLLGESRGQQMMDDLDVFAKATPFKSSEVIAQSQKMLAMGWDAEKIIEDMTIIGDAAAATGKGEEGLQRIVLALAQIKSKGKLSTEELNQLAEAGISAKRYLAEGLGYGSGDDGVAKLSKDLEKGAIGSEKALKALTEGMKEYQGMMEKTANETAKGLWSQISDTFEINIFRRWGQGLQDGAKRGFGSVVTLLEEADGALEKFGDTVYEVGKNISNWLADKFENAIKRITEITGSFEFKNASLGEKLSMLWDGVIVDPLKEWWEGGGQAATAKTAGNIGKWMGEFITDGLLALFGATEVFNDGIGTDTGKSIAGSFLRGFLDAFDGNAITQAFVDAISNVWNALPWWGKVLVGGYAGGKVIGGVGNVVGGAMNLFGGIGSVIGSAGAGSGILGYGANAAVALGAGNLAGGASLGAGALSALGLGATAGGIVAGAGLIHAGRSIYDSYQAYEQGDTVRGRAGIARGGLTLAGIGGGALVGAKAGAAIGSVGGPVGTLIGAGLGTVVGWFAGDKIARNIEAAKYESKEMQEAIKDSEKSAEELAQTFEKAKWENLKNHFGDIKLSMSEIERLADQIVWGDDLGSFEKFTSATKNAEANLQSMKSAYQQADKWMWKAGLGVKFNENEKKSFKAAFDEYISSAKSFVENKHYEFTASVSMLVDVESKEGKNIIESGNAYYGKLKGDLDKAGKELGDALSKALEDGIIDADENKAIAAAQQKIASITEKIANAEQKAELQLIKVKFGSGKMDIESFDSFMSTMQTTIDERMSANDKAYVASVSSLELQLADKAITKEEYDKQLQALIDGYNDTNAKLKAEIKNVELEIIGDAYSKELGKNAKEKLGKALDEALKTGIDPVEWSDEELCKLLGIDKLGPETASNIKEMLSGVISQLRLIPEEVDSVIPDKIEKSMGVNIRAEKEIQNNIDVIAEDFGIPREKAAAISMLLHGDKHILNQIDVSQLAKEFGIPESQVEKVIEKLIGEKSIQNRINILASDFGIKPYYNYSTVVSVTAKYKVSGKMTETGIKGHANKMANQLAKDGFVNSARGGLWYPAGSNAPGFATGGIVRGGARLIKVAEEGTPEMIIPLSSQRRDRGLKLWEKAGEMLGVQGFFRGGRTDNGDEGLRFEKYGANESAGGRNVKVDVGGVNVTIQVDAKGSDNIVDAIKAQGNEIAETVAGILADAFGGQFENTPVRGG